MALARLRSSLSAWLPRMSSEAGGLLVTKEGLMMSYVLFHVSFRMFGFTKGPTCGLFFLFHIEFLSKSKICLFFLIKTLFRVPRLRFYRRDCRICIDIALTDPR